ncbi:flagellar assembly protein FliW [Microbacterium sp. ISL-103]|uniref:flagellar assembly protein FliW n=1 Tax=Microbacterium sp. ISL-103 TaxID=2819156 RepID=UPI001BE4E7CB|nr:flagellar assembly protein FliW [Microbacterium sp. ISL-103]MBT2473820.1 flagellar assembly protein FliW [Microbacterium sp. ISL-103]
MTATRAQAAHTAQSANTAVEFASPMPGLSPYTAFTLEQIAGAEGLYALRADDADVRLFVLDPQSGEYGYEPSIPGDVRAEIGAADDSVIRVFVVANPSAEGVYINLRAPIVIHRDTGRAAQVILDDQAYPIRALLGS